MSWAVTSWCVAAGPAAAATAAAATAAPIAVMPATTRPARLTVFCVGLMRGNPAGAPPGDAQFQARRTRTGLLWLIALLCVRSVAKRMVRTMANQATYYLMTLG